MRLEQTSWMEVREKLNDPQGIIMATGSTEQHGPIGLIGTDTICSETIASDVAARANMYLAPSIGFTPEIGRAHVRTPVTSQSRMPSSA